MNWKRSKKAQSNTERDTSKSQNGSDQTIIYMNREGKGMEGKGRAGQGRAACLELPYSTQP